MVSYRRQLDTAARQQAHLIYQEFVLVSKIIDNNSQSDTIVLLHNCRFTLDI